MWQKLFLSAALSFLACSQSFAAELFRSEFNNGLLKYVGSSNKHPGGGYVRFLGGEIGSYYIPSDGCGDLGVQDVVMDSSSDAQGGPSEAQNTALKTHYTHDCGKSFQKNTTIIYFPAQQEVYVRWYQKWSPQWVWPSIQQKFIKLTGGNSSQNFFFDSSNMKVNYVAPEGQTKRFDPGNDDRTGSDTVNFQTNRWYEVQMHVRVSDAGKDNGILEWWVDGVQYFGMYSVRNNKGNSGIEKIDHVELQHVYDGGSGNGNDGYPPVDSPTWMKNIVISTSFISSGPVQAAPNPPSSIE